MGAGERLRGGDGGDKGLGLMGMRGGIEPSDLGLGVLGFE